MATTDQDSHLIFSDLMYPMIRLHCSCEGWEKKVPAISGEKGMRDAADEHRRAVFGEEAES